MASPPAGLLPDVYEMDLMKVRSYSKIEPLGHHNVQQHHRNPTEDAKLRLGRAPPSRRLSSTSSSMVGGVVSSSACRAWLGPVRIVDDPSHPNTCGWTRRFAFQQAPTANHLLTGVSAASLHNSSSRSSSSRSVSYTHLTLPTIYSV